MAKMELLSPAGDWDALVAAVENGADAVYLGLKGLNARRGAGNFDDAALVRAAQYCHERGKRVYVTVNTILKQDELPLLEDVARALADAGADAAIVQDFGVCQALREMLPSLALHASTQMAVHNPQGAAFLRDQGFARVVLARELTFPEIRACRDTGIAVEVFCHGALCVACSGQCLFSSMVGGRSGNRGMCAQPCRLPYRLEGAANAEGYLLSPKDLCAIECLGDMEDARADSLKIEGRLKRPEYVAVVTRAYRRALDGEKITREDMDALRQIFNRGGFTRGYGPGVVDSTFISIARPSHWGLKVGDAVSAREIRLKTDVDVRDALVVRTEAGEDASVRLSGRAGVSVKNPCGARGELVRLVSEEQMNEARESVRETRRTVNAQAEIEIRVGEPARARVTDGRFSAQAEGWWVEKANRPETDVSRAAAQFEKTGGTPYRMTDVTIRRDADAFIPLSGVNALRRDALSALSSARMEGLRGCERRVLPRKYECVPEAPSHARLVAQASDAALLRAALDAGADEIAFLPGDVRAGRMDAQTVSLSRFFLCVPPVLPGEALQTLNDWALSRAEHICGTYISNVGQLGLRWPGERRLDYALNIANAPALAFLGAQTLIYTPSLELTAREIERLNGKRELVVYGRVPLMHLRHCPLNAALGGGAHAACHRCDAAGAKLRDSALVDRMRARFPLARTATDAGCVIDVNNSVPMMLAKHARKLPSATGWRMLFTGESAKDAREITALFRALIDGKEAEGRDYIENITTGHYFRPVE